MTELIHTIKPEDLTSEGKLRDDFVPDGVKEHVRKEGIDPNNVGYIYVGGSKSYSSEGIILAKTRWYGRILTEDEIQFISREKYE